MWSCLQPGLDFQVLYHISWPMYELSSKDMAFAFYHTFSPTTKEEVTWETHPFMARKQPRRSNVCLFWNGKAARPGLEEGLTLLRNPHQSLTKWDPQGKALLGDESREWREWKEGVLYAGQHICFGPREGFKFYICNILVQRQISDYPEPQRPYL